MIMVVLNGDDDDDDEANDDGDDFFPGSVSCWTGKAGEKADLMLK